MKKKKQLKQRLTIPGSYNQDKIDKIMEHCNDGKISRSAASKKILEIKKNHNKQIPLSSW